MAVKIFWTEEAISSYDKVIDYLEENWTEKEIAHFTENVANVLALLSEGNVQFRSSIKKNYHEALINKQNLLIYRIKPDQIELIMFWDTRKNPKKKKF
ncbi:MAG: type II toxin-antitoxin system RelE/ParE family toxin [Bacteroidota bacterium]|nr:type II toxin-antitoxin system RelE/ParE family toxin [Bacteroidota bacterium]